MDADPNLLLRCWLSLYALAAVVFFPATAVPAQAETGLLVIEAKVPLGPVRGRIDHMAIDAVHKRLFVAELGNDSVGIVDIAARKTVRTIGGLSEPQGVGYVPSKDTLYVANARDGSVRLFHGPEYPAAGRIELGSDADNVRFDDDGNRVLVGFGSGAIAAIDIVQQRKIGDISLPAHPESFQIGGEPRQVFVNIPGAHAVAVLDAVTGRENARWPLREGGNFPLALDRANHRIVVVSRNPPLLIGIAADGSISAKADTCSDSDDLFVDEKRNRLYVSCGEGFIDVFETQPASFRRLERIPTVSGARTSLFVPELDVLLLAARATATEAAAIWIFKPAL